MNVLYGIKIVFYFNMNIVLYMYFVFIFEKYKTVRLATHDSSKKGEYFDIHITFIVCSNSVCLFSCLYSSNCFSCLFSKCFFIFFIRINT